MNLLRWLIIAALLCIYAGTLFAVLHPKVSPGYRAYYMDRSSSDWNPEHYPGTPEKGIEFSRVGLPEWVESTHGLSFRDQWGRWTDTTVGPVPGLTFARSFNGPVCVQFVATAVPAVGKTFTLKLGDQSQMVQVIPKVFGEYQVELEPVRPASRLDFVLPPQLPREADVDSHSSDMRRLGLELTSLRILSGPCTSPTLSK
jgi:hypothetical protein